MQDVMRQRMPTIPEDLSEYARIHTGPGSWSADTDFEPAQTNENAATPRPPYVRIHIDELDLNH